MIDLSIKVPNLHHKISLTSDAKLDIQWWLDLVPKWPGKSLIFNSRWTPSPALHQYTDASGLHGWSAYWEGRGLQSHWSPTQREMDIS